MNYMQKTPFIELYEELSCTFDVSEMEQLQESAVPSKTTELVDLKNCREVISSKYNKILGEYESNCITTVNNQLCRVEVRVFVLRKEPQGEILFLGRPYSHGSGFTTPGGGYDLADKTVQNTAKRELYEELNINLKNLQESNIHSFYSLPRCSWVKKYIENPEDRWTGYYQYYVTAEYAGESTNETPEEFGKFSWLPISLFDGLTDSGSVLSREIIAGHTWSQDIEPELEEAFNKEEIWGEAAYTEPGVVRYFADSLETLIKILKTGKIKTSELLEADPNSIRGKGNKRVLYNRRPFVSFSHQLYSHAYRSTKWRYGVAIDEEILRSKIPEPEINITDNFKHASKNIYVYGAARLNDGSDVIITSYGDFVINWNLETRQLISQYLGVDLKPNNYYDQIKNFFSNLEKLHYSEDPERIKKAMRSRNKDQVLEGFVTYTLLQSSGVRLIDLNLHIDGLLKYLQEYTYLDEGELRIWMDWLEDHEYLDISECLIGLVLPSNFKEDRHNKPADIQWIQEFAQENNLKYYLFDAEKTPKKADHPGRVSSFATSGPKRSLADYFDIITASPEAIFDFIKQQIYPRAQKFPKFDLWRFYMDALAAETTADRTTIAKSTEFNLAAFLDKANNLGISKTTIRYLAKTGADRTTL